MPRSEDRRRNGCDVVQRGLAEPVHGDGLNALTQRLANGAGQRVARADLDECSHAVRMGLRQRLRKVDLRNGLPGQHVRDHVRVRRVGAIDRVGIEAHALRRLRLAMVQPAPGLLVGGHHRRMHDKVMRHADGLSAELFQHALAAARIAGDDAVARAVEDGEVAARLARQGRTDITLGGADAPRVPLNRCVILPGRLRCFEGAGEIVGVHAALANRAHQPVGIGPRPEGDERIGLAGGKPHRNGWLHAKQPGQQEMLGLGDQRGGAQLVVGGREVAGEQAGNMLRSRELRRHHGAKLGDTGKQALTHSGIGRRCAGKDEGKIAARVARAIMDAVAGRGTPGPERGNGLVAPVGNRGFVVCDQGDAARSGCALLANIHCLGQRFGRRGAIGFQQRCRAQQVGGWLGPRFQFQLAAGQLDAARVAVKLGGEAVALQPVAARGEFRFHGQPRKPACCM